MEAILATLLKFERAKKSPDAGKPVSGNAQILIFTGVRYERGTTPPPSDLDSKRRRRKRG
jgi:hypothetical protein